MIMWLGLAFAADPQVVRAEQQLGMEPDFAQAIRDGLEQIYLRQYPAARATLASTEEAYPDRGMGSVGDALVWQALMLENFDYKYEKQYWVSAKAVRKDLDKALRVAGNDAFEHFIYGGMVGIEAIHNARRGKYLGALQLAFEAMDHLEQCRTLAPEYTDLVLADGMYNYWRSVITNWSSMLPHFEDHKAEGIEQMKVVEAEGVFLEAAATLSLAFAHIQERDKEGAKEDVDRIRASYPDNVINNLLAGSVYLSLGKYDTARGMFDEVLEDSKSNKRALYWRGITNHKAGRLEDALRDYKAYLKADYLEPSQRSYTYYRMGRVYQKQKKYKLAEEAYHMSVKIDRFKPAKARIDILRRDKRSGKISY